MNRFGGKRKESVNLWAFTWKLMGTFGNVWIPGHTQMRTLEGARERLRVAHVHGRSTAAFSTMSSAVGYRMKGLASNRL